MSRTHRHIKSQININYEEKEGVRQTSQTVHAESRLVENTKAERQTETPCFVENMESKSVGVPA